MVAFTPFRESSARLEFFNDRNVGSGGPAFAMPLTALLRARGSETGARLPVLIPGQDTTLEQQLQRKLAHTRWESGADGAESGAGGLGIRDAEVGVVGNVEELRAELQPRGFVDVEELIDGGVPLLESGTPERIASQVAERVAGRRGSEGVSGEIGVQHGRAALTDGAAADVGAQKRLAAIIVGKRADNVGAGGRISHVQGGSPCGRC